MDFLFFSRERNAHGSNYHVSIFRRREKGRRGSSIESILRTGRGPRVFEATGGQPEGCSFQSKLSQTASGRSEEVAVQFFVRVVLCFHGDYVGAASFRSRRAEEIMNAIEL